MSICNHQDFKNTKNCPRCYPKYYNSLLEDVSKREPERNGVKKFESPNGKTKRDKIIGKSSNKGFYNHGLEGKFSKKALIPTSLLDISSPPKSHKKKGDKNG